MIMFGMPAVIVRDHRNARVAHLRFTGQFGFGNIGHPDNVAVQAPVHFRFGTSRKLGAFHRQIRSAQDGVDTDFLCGLMNEIRKAGASRMSHRHVSDTTASEERPFTGYRPVDVLIDDDEGAGSEVFFQ